LAIPEDSDEPVGCVVGKVDEEEVTLSSMTMDTDGMEHSTTPSGIKTGYIGMLAVSESYRRRGIGKALVRQVLQRMKDMGCTSATLETEVTNKTAQTLYQDIFGFIREELLVRYYLNWNDAYRLRLWF
jgi:N-alpha-acetyltransferase 30